MEKPASQSESAAKQRPRRQPRPYKRCAALVHRRSSFWFLFAEFLEARIVADRVPYRIEAQKGGRERGGACFVKQALAPRSCAVGITKDSVAARAGFLRARQTPLVLLIHLEKTSRFALE